MENDKVKYLDEERVKLWKELRETQECLKSIKDAFSRDVEAENRALTSLDLKASRAYGHIKAREKESAAVLESVSEHKSQIEVIAQTVFDFKEKVDIVQSDLVSKNDEISNALNVNKNLIEEFNLEFTQLKATFNECQQKLDVLKESEREAKTCLDDFLRRYSTASKEAKEIENLHNLLYGYEKEDGSQVEGRKKKLENVYGALIQKFDALQERMDNFEEENKQACSDIVSNAREELCAVKEKLESLLPDALTAGLSSAYAKNREMEQKEQAKNFFVFASCIVLMILLALIPVGINFWLWWYDKRDVFEILAKLPREMLCILPLYVPLLWLAFFANKRVNLSKRLIEEYKHKEAVSKTYEGLAKQIASLNDEKVSRELQARLLYNTVMLSEKNPGELIKNFNRPDNPLIDVLNSGHELSESLNKLAAFPGMSRIIKKISDRRKKVNDSMNEAMDAVED